MIIANRIILKEFCRTHPDATTHINALINEFESAIWETPVDVKQRYPRASIIDDSSVVFNVRNNRYRLLVLIDYQRGIVLIKNVGTHKEYDRWRIKQ